MPDYAYTTVTGKIKLLFDKIRTVGVPQKVTQAWLKTLGFTSSNDATLIGVLKFIGLIDQSGIPTTRWSSFRGATHKVVLGEAIRQGYATCMRCIPTRIPARTPNCSTFSARVRPLDSRS
jgi:hypothetical protein